MAVGSAAKAIVSWALRGTKQLSPYSSKYIKLKRGSKSGFHTGIKIQGSGQYRPWFKKVAVGDKSWLGSMGIGEKGRARFVSGYTKSYKHLRKHKGKYGSGVAGAAAWDFLPGKDNE
tara:strand:+ start:559 stop:909 length:351 start_codon:yes stop_codon:yes gene_type:complete